MKERREKLPLLNAVKAVHYDFPIQWEGIVYFDLTEFVHIYGRVTMTRSQIRNVSVTR